MKTKIFLTIIFVFIIINSRAQSWVPIGSGANNNVLALYSDTATNTLYVGGSFTQFNGVLANYIIKYDGSNWTAMGNGFNNVVYSIIKYNGQIYAGGAFIYADGNLVNTIAKWNGTSWVPVGSGICPTYSGVVSTMEIYNDELYVAGTFTPSLGSTYNLIAKWNDTTWTNMGNSFTGFNPSIRALKTYKGELYAGGSDFYDSASIMTIARYNGYNWSEVAPGTHGTITAFEVFNNDLYVGGCFDNSCGYSFSSNKVVIWNGEQWLPANLGMNGIVYSLKSFNGNLYAGGTFTTADSGAVENIAKWDGTNWTDMPGMGLNDLVWCIGSYNEELYSGGMFTNAGGNPANHIAKWSVSNHIISFDRNNNIKIYPQPFDINATIEFENNNKVFSLNIIDSKGRTVQQKNNITSGKITIERNNMVRGLYFYILSDDESNVYSGKIIVE